MRHDDYVSEGYELSDWLENGDEPEVEEGSLLDQFLIYHDEMELHEYNMLGQNEKARMWSNFKLMNPNATSPKYKAKCFNMKQRYEENKKAKVGTDINCAGCGKKMVKKSYQSQFCRNKGSGNCKDKYWNNTDDKRRSRAQFINSL